MDEKESSAGRSALYQPFINTANALASLYKQAATLERDGRDAGSRTAYQNIMQWAARKRLAGEAISPGDVISLCASELASLPQPTLSSNPTLPPVSSNTTSSRHALNAPSSGALNNPPASHVSDMVLDSPGNSAQVTVPPTAYIPRDDGLVSDIRKLNVNSRKRQRVEITEAFKDAFGGVDNASFLFADDRALASPDRSVSPRNTQADAIFFGPHTTPITSRQEACDTRDACVLTDAHHSRDRNNSRDNRADRGDRDFRGIRESSFNDVPNSALITHSGRRTHSQDKVRRKQQG